MKNKCRKFKRNYTYTFTLLLLTLAITFVGRAKHYKAWAFDNNLTAIADTILPSTDTIPPRSANDSINGKLPADSLRPDSVAVKKVDSFHVKISKDSIDAPVAYKAKDSMVLDVVAKKLYLYTETNVKYKDVDLTAPEIAFDQQTNLVKARMKLDTAGKSLGQAKLVQADIVTVSDSIEFNFKTQKGLTHSSYFQQNELFNYAEVVKKVDAKTIYAFKGRFTTCNLDTPHFAFRARKIKYISQKVAVTGPVGVEFENVPVAPVILPFGMFPLATGRKSGILAPQFTVTSDYGIGLEGLGYYKVISDNFDFTVRGDLYSYGSWRFNFAPTYKVRYKYSGGLNFSYQNTHFGISKQDKDYSPNKSFLINWSHRMDSKARPGVSFSASVNAGSSSYIQRVTTNGYVDQSNGAGGTYTQPLSFSNQMSSSISYQKSWQGKPYNLSVNLNHNQNTNTKIVNLNLPDINFNVQTLYPLQPKELAGSPKWYQKLGIGYTGSARGQTSFYDDSTLTFQKIIDTFQYGAQHSIPITLALPQLGSIQISPGFSYQERWYSQKFIRSWDTTNKRVDTTIQKGFYTARDISFSISFSTSMFGTLNFKNKNAKVQAIRQVIRPQMSLGYKPDISQSFYRKVQTDTLGTIRYLSDFERSIYGSFGSGRSGSIGFGIDNFVEMKVRKKASDSTSTGEGEEDDVKKVKLIDGYGITGSYNLLADSFKLSTFNLYARSTLFEKINITANASIDPYEVDPRNGRRINRYAWQAGKLSLGRITNGSVSMSTSFKSKSKKDQKAETDKLSYDNYDNLTADQIQSQMDYIRNNPSEFVDFNIPWSINLSYSLSFSRVLRSDYSGYDTRFSSSMNFNGDFSLTEKWKFGANGYLDVKALKIPSFSMFITREMHCWQMAINVTPFGLWRSFNISIFPKSGMLRDLKINRNRSFRSTAM